MLVKFKLKTLQQHIHIVFVFTLCLRSEIPKARLVFKKNFFGDEIRNCVYLHEKVKKNVQNFVVDAFYFFDDHVHVHVDATSAVNFLTNVLREMKPSSCMFKVLLYVH